MISFHFISFHFIFIVVYWFCICQPCVKLLANCIHYCSSQRENFVCLLVNQWYVTILLNNILFLCGSFKIKIEFDAKRKSLSTLYFIENWVLQWFIYKNLQILISFKFNTLFLHEKCSSMVNHFDRFYFYCCCGSMISRCKTKLKSIVTSCVCVCNHLRLLLYSFLFYSFISFSI